MRLSALIPASLATVLALSLLPAAAQQAEDDPPRLGAEPSVGAREDSSGRVAEGSAGWEPGDLDVDWAEFAAGGRAAYEASSWAAAAREQDTAPVRAMLAEGYAEATGADIDPADVDPSYDQLTPTRSAAFAQQYYDECDDGTNLPENGVQASRQGLYRGGADTAGGVSYNPVGGAIGSAPPPRVDIRSTFLVQTTDDGGRFDQTGFLFYGCQQWADSDLGPSGITYGLYTNFEEGETQYPTVLGDPEIGPDFVVAIFPEPNIPHRPLQVMAIRTPSRDRSTWTITFIGPASRLDAYEIDGVVPTSAIGDFTADSGFAWTIESADSQQPPGRDWFPERNYQLRAGEGEDEEVGTHIPQFPVPDDCGLQTESADAYTLEPQAVTPNDDGYRFQWYHPTLRTPEAWETIRDSSGGGRARPVTVAVVDTGIDSTRFDFTDGGPRITTGLDAVYGLELEGEDNGGALGPFLGPRSVGYEAIGHHPRNSDRDPHGTGVASLIGARGGNSFGIAGVDWGVRLMPIRVNDVNGCITSVVVAEGIKWAVDHGADVVHISLAATEVPTIEDPERPGIDGVPECDDGLDNDADGRIDHDGGPGEGISDDDCTGPEDELEGADGTALDPLRETIDYALEKSVPVVAASGNFAGEGDPIIYPAAYPGVIAVGATTRAGEWAPYSSTGRWIHVAAPGGNNSNTLAGDLAALWELDRIRSVAGTSFSAPLVTGAISLYMGLNPHIARGFVPAAAPQPPQQNYDDSFGYQRTVDDIRIAVQSFARDLPPAGHDIRTGWGLLDIDRMLDLEALGGPLIDPARVQILRTAADSVIEAAETIALSRPTTIPPYVVFARNDVAVDALAGAPLLAEGPLLVSYRDYVVSSTMDVLRQLMPDGGPVYLLGGEQALSPAVEQQLRDAGYTPRRLAGPTRFETALSIAEEVRTRWPGSSQVAVARADGGDNPSAQWADALTGGAWAAATRTPMVVTSTDALHPAVAESLQRWGTTSTVAFGGAAALSDQVLGALPSPTRIAGEERAGTAVAVADRLWEDVDGYMLVNGYYARGWVHGLAAAGWAAETGQALLYTGASDLPPATAEALTRACPSHDDVRLIGGASLITGTAESHVAEAIACG